MKKLPDGIYIEGESLLHKLDSTVKLILFIILIAAVIAADSLLGYIALFCLRQVYVSFQK